MGMFTVMLWPVEIAVALVLVAASRLGANPRRGSGAEAVGSACSCIGTLCR
jgi:hypothetical protein